MFKKQNEIMFENIDRSIREIRPKSVSPTLKKIDLIIRKKRKRKFFSVHQKTESEDQTQGLIFLLPTLLHELI